MASTDDGLPLIGAGGGDPDLIRRRVAEARELADPDERAARLYFLGRGLFDCDDPEKAGLVLRWLVSSISATGAPVASPDAGETGTAQMSLVCDWVL